MAAAIQVQESTSVNVRTTGRIVYLQNTPVDRARHLLSLTYSATLGAELRQRAFSCGFGLRKALLQPSRLYPIPFMLLGAWAIFVIHELLTFDNKINGGDSDDSSFFDGVIGCIVPDFFNGGKEGDFAQTVMTVYPNCRSGNKFVGLMMALMVIAQTVVFIWDYVAISTIRKIRTAPERSLCFVQVPVEMIPDAMNDIVEMDITNDTQLRGIGIIDESTAIIASARSHQVTSISLNIYDINFHRRYFAPWSSYFFFAALVPFILTWFILVSQRDGGDHDWRDAAWAHWLRRVGLFAMAIRGVVEGLRFLYFVYKKVLSC